MLGLRPAPEFGRRLAEDCRELLAPSDPPPDVAIVVSDGLSAQAVTRYAIGLLAAFLPLAQREGWRLAPIVVVAPGRVAIEDEIGQLLGAKAAVILLGERPGLSSPDSLGAYLVFDPRPGRTDAERNSFRTPAPRAFPPPRPPPRYIICSAKPCGGRSAGWG